VHTHAAHGTPATRTLGWALLSLLVLAISAAVPQMASASSIIQTTGFESGSLSANGKGLALSMGGATPAPTIVSSPVRNGNYALHEEAAGLDNVKYSVNSSKTMTVRFGVYFEQFPTIVAAQNAADVHVDTTACPGASANARPFKLKISNTGQLSLVISDYASGATVGSVTGPTIALNTWHYIDMSVDISDPGGTWTNQWSVDGVAQPTSTGPGTSAGACTIKDLEVGTSTSGYSWIADYDDLTLSTALADYPIGDGQVLGYPVMATGTHAIATAGDYAYSVNNGGAWTNITTAENNTTPGSSPDIDDWPLLTTGSIDLVRQSGGLANWLEYKVADTPLGENPRAVEVVGGFREAATGTNNITVNAMSGASSATAINNDPSGGTTSVNYFASALTTAPGGAAWTPTLFNGLNLRLQSSDFAPAVWTDSLMVEADFPPATNPTITVGPSTVNDCPGTTVSWSTDQSGTSEVWYDTVSHGAGLPATYAFNSVDTTLTGPAHAVSLAGLTPGTTYYYKVQTKNGAGLPVYSAEASFVAAQPAAPLTAYTADLNAQPGTTNAANITVPTPHFSFVNNSGCTIDRQRVRTWTDLLDSSVKGLWHLDGNVADSSSVGNNMTLGGAGQTPTYVTSSASSALGQQPAL